MQRIVLRLFVALLTFALGVAITAIISMKLFPMLSPTNVAKVEEPKIDITISPPNLSCYPGRSIETATIKSSAYFPPKILSENEHSDKFKVDWYSRHLGAMDEAPLYFSDDGWLESYRFLWLRSFHHPVAVHIWRCGSVRFIAVKEMSGAGGYEPGKLTLNKTRELSMAEWNEFKRHLNDSCYWQLPTTDENVGFDGAQWIFEAVEGGRYHIVDRWSPQNGSYRGLCLYALELSGLKIDTASEPLY